MHQREFPAIRYLLSIEINLKCNPTTGISENGSVLGYASFSGIAYPQKAVAPELIEYIDLDNILTKLNREA